MFRGQQMKNKERWQEGEQMMVVVWTFGGKRVLTDLHFSARTVAFKPQGRKRLEGRVVFFPDGDSITEYGRGKAGGYLATGVAWMVEETKVVCGSGRLD